MSILRNDPEQYIHSITSKDDLNIVLCKEYLPYIKDNLNELILSMGASTIAKFLFYCSQCFDRFLVPMNWYIALNDYVFYREYLNLLIIVENDHLDNIIIFKLHDIAWQILNHISQESNFDIKSYSSQIRNINNKIMELNWEKRQEYHEFCDKLLNLLEGISNNNLQTLITFKIPVSPVIKNTIIQTTYEGKDLTVKLNPKSQNHPISFLENTIATQDSNSNWQRYSCNIEIEIQGYIDLLIEEKKLYFEFDGSNPLEPKIFSFIFNILSNISWKLRKRSNTYLSNWLLSPNDIEHVIYDFKANDTSFQWIYFPIKSGYKCQPIESDTEFIKIDLIDEIRWHEKCLIRAEDWLSVGETQLSVFWLNIGIESFFESLIKEASKHENFQNEDPFSENYFERTKRELEKINKPENFSKIIWPSPDKIHLSMFKKIKILFDREILDITLKKEALEKLSHVSKHRNAIFHGTNEDIVEIEFVKKALESYRWLVLNCKIEKA